MLLTDGQSEKIWDKVHHDLRFDPSVDPGVLPFVIPMPHLVFDIRETAAAACDQFDRLITDAFVRCTAPGELIYALDWQHSDFLFDPREPQQMASVHIEDEGYFGGGYAARFPAYYPDGDYCFFIHQHFRFGYLAHPWRQEVWIFGDSLLAEFQKIYGQLGWTMEEDL